MGGEGCVVTFKGLTLWKNCFSFHNISAYTLEFRYFLFPYTIISLTAILHTYVYRCYM